MLVQRLTLLSRPFLLEQQYEINDYENNCSQFRRYDSRTFVESNPLSNTKKGLNTKRSSNMEWW